MNTPVTSTISPNIEVISLRIKPASWYGYPVLRFDVGGCQERGINNGHSMFARKSAALSEEMIASHTVVPAMSVSTLKDCAFTCRDYVTCIAFSYETDNGINWCKGFSAWIVNPGKLSSNEAVFINQGLLDSYGYREEQGGAFLYSVIEVRKDQVSASATCRAQYTRLFRIDSELKMASLTTIIAGNNVLKNNYNFYVSGRYNSPTWMHDGGTDEIDDILWAPDNPNPDQGHCVMLTEAGLASVDCADKLYSICGH
ncbi:uncharacterized protein LOC117333777 [Pecten maximus]|uniref:uncharacterized protein LOC117333777 n=1 Tax=Pecten maximus TaxID=6579 RepID=UPI001458B4AA|nr:uncharacterized protein LOC117333777 [Pecten maximus]